MVVASMVYRGTHQGDFPWGPHPPYKPTGKPVRFGEILISRIADGKIAEDWFSIDFTDVWQQFAALPV
jgi:predicted ester cyclase